MSPVFAGILMAVAVLGAAIVAIAVPLLLAVMLYEIASAQESAPVEVEHTPLKIAAKRGVARAFVLGGGLFWSLASFAGLYSYHETGLGYALLAALYPLTACAVTLVVGWYYERIVAALLVMAAFAVIAWGVIYQFELGVWVLMVLALIGPMLTAAALFWLARRDQDAFELEFRFRPQLSPIFSARSRMAPMPAVD